jgi:ubiquinone/menaquinone biosynthesis C-methylase UbiE
MMEKYDTIGKGYNKTRRADPYLSSRFIAHLSSKVDGTYLDIGCGTGNYTYELNKAGLDFIGIDPSKEMLAKAMLNYPNINWQVGQADNTGLTSESVAGIVGSLTVHHWPVIEQGFSELFRVLEKNGRIVIFSSTAEQMQGYWLNEYFPKMMDLSIQQMQGFETIKQGLEVAGFEDVKIELYSIKPDLEDLFLYCGKHRPERYLDPQIRNGISSFSDLANLVEVKRGLKLLESDLLSGRIWEVIENYENNKGDYLFFIGQK